MRVELGANTEVKAAEAEGTDTGSEGEADGEDEALAVMGENADICVDDMRGTF